MRSIIFALFLCAVALVSYSECFPPIKSAEMMEFERRRDESIRQVIQKEGVTRENVNEFYSRGRNLNDKGHKAIAELCVYHFEPFVCEGHSFKILRKFSNSVYLRIS
ncbi:uncharacterized protein LOC100680315 [Nasonia vitripennis]|uniref:Uncharacterized protein n=1 Tax=Nasonia vitripennis TaxID=7425 RepID=A0A7M7H9R4_NASVI|nr:uncharacterized protein LOC100680315 [Nasonia vitripennis]